MAASHYLLRVQDALDLSELPRLLLLPHDGAVWGAAMRSTISGCWYGIFHTRSGRHHARAFCESEFLALHHGVEELPVQDVAGAEVGSVCPAAGGIADACAPP